MTPLREILVVHHTHTDWGYTAHPRVVEEQHHRYIDQAVELCRQHRDADPMRRYRWTCESAWVVHGWLRVRTLRQRRAFLDCVRREEIEVAAMPLHPTPLADARTIAAALKMLDELRAEGISISVALICDINGLSWPWADALLDAGVETLCAAMNFVCGGGLKRWTAFQWKAASGRKLPCWQGTHYNQGVYWGLNHNAYTIREVAPQRIAELKDFPFEKLLLQVTNIPADNMPPHPRYLDYLADYNRLAAERDWPRMRPSLLREWVDFLSPRVAVAPVYTGDWTDWWASGVASMPRETAALMEAQRRIGVAERRGLSAKRAESVRRKIFLAAEHTWCASTSVKEPFKILSVAGLAAKQEIIYTAATDASEALRVSLQPRHLMFDPALEAFDPAWNEMIGQNGKTELVQPLRAAAPSSVKVDWEHLTGFTVPQVIMEEPADGSRTTWFQVGKFNRPESHGCWPERPRWKRTILRAAWITRQIEGDVVRIEARVKLGFTTRPRSLYLVFPFRLRATSVLADVGGAWADPRAENVPGSCKNWWTAHRGVLLRGRWGSVLWTPWDAPLVMFDAPCPGPPKRRNRLNPPVLVSWALNTYWFTNFAGLSGGEYTFRYRMKYWPTFVKACEVERFCESDPLADYPPIAAATRDECIHY